MSHPRKAFRFSALFLFLMALALTISVGANVFAQEGDEKIDEEARRLAYFERVEADIQASLSDPDLPAMGFTPCVGGTAGGYACNNVDLLAFMPHNSLGGSTGNDIWGWTDPLDGKEYALVGQSNGTAFVDISTPETPVYLGRLPTHTSNTTWRDIKVYNNYAFIVSEASGHGMQVFDLTKLRNVPAPPTTFSEDAHYSGFGNAHNIVINEDTGYAYGVGTNTCSGGLHFVDISNPLSPTGAGCFSADGYTHDAQCIVYTGPDTTYQGDEICFNYNEDTLTIVNVTNKAAPVQIARELYSGRGYTHQGWITEDHSYVLLGDELDEQNFGHNTRTRIWDVSDLDNPELINFYDGVNPSIDHNLYILDGYAYESNYTSGLQILDLVDIANGNLSMPAYFDTYQPNNNASFSGSWSNYPYFDSGVVIVNGIGEGLFVLQPTLAPDYSISADPSVLDVCNAGSDSSTVSLAAKSGYTGTVTLSATGLPAGSSADFTPTSVVVPGNSTMDVTVTSTAVGSYDFNIHGDDGSIQHDETVTLNVFAGDPAAPTLISPANGATNVVPAPLFTWDVVSNAVSYDFELATDAGFTNVIDSTTTSQTSYQTLAGLDPLSTYYWRVAASNTCGTGVFSTVFSFTTRDIPPILLVDDDDNSPNVQATWTGALAALGLNYDLFDTANSDNEPTAGELASYDVVLWFSGDEFGGAAGPGTAGEAALATYLDNGGCLFISSQDYHYDKGLTAFMTNYLGVSGLTDDNGDYTSVTGDNVFAGLGPYPLNYPYSDYSDPITVGNGGEIAMLGNNGKVSGVTKDGGDYRTSFWAFGWEALSASGRQTTLQTFVDWCGELNPSDQMIFLPIVVKDQ